MRKKYLQKGLVLGMIFFSGCAFGQVEETRSGKIKDDQVTRTYLDLLLNVVGTNLNYGNSNSALADYKKSVLGVQVGASFQAGVTPRVSLLTELYFMMKGGGLNAKNPLTTYNTNIRLYTLELPLLARVHFGKLHFNAGPSIAYNIYGSRKIEGSTSDISFNYSAEGFKRWEAGIQMGGGYRFQTKRKSILMDVRYNYGLTDISNGEEMYNRSLVISLHFSKPWKKNLFAKK